MSAFDVKKICTFDGISFPVQEVALTGAIRRHTHLFPYSPGGATEFLARDNYKIKIKTVFCDSFEGFGESLYPTALNELRRRFEASKSASLDVPNLGVIKAYGYSWIFTMSSKIQNGEDAEIVFEEDTTELFSVETMLAQKASGFGNLTDDFAVQADELKKRSLIGSLVNILDTITDKANLIKSSFDQIELFSSLIAAQIDALTDIIGNATDTFNEFKDPSNLAFIESTKNLWRAAIDLKETVAGTGNLKFYVVQRDSTLAEVGIQIFGSTSKAQQLLSLNTINDPFLIPEGTTLIYFD